MLLTYVRRWKREAFVCWPGCGIAGFLVGIGSSVSGASFSGGRVHPDFPLFQGRGYVGNIGGNSHSTYSQGGEPSPSWEVSDYVPTLVEVPE